MVLATTLRRLLILNLAVKACYSTLIKTNHKLGLGPYPSSLVHLCKKLEDPKSPKKCNIVSCIGANHWRQRHFLEKDLGLDPSESPTLSGPLKPRNVLWEDAGKDGYKFLLDSEIPNFENELKSDVDNTAFLKLSALSRCILVFLNEGDFEVSDGAPTLSKNVRVFFERLAKRLELHPGSGAEPKDVYVILPDFTSFKSQMKPDRSQIQALERALTKFFPKNLYVKEFNGKFHLSKYLGTPPNLNVTDVVDVLKSLASPNSAVAAGLDYLKHKSYQNLKKFLDESLERSYKSQPLPDFTLNYHAKLLDSRFSYYIAVMDKLGRNFPIDPVDVEDVVKARTCLSRVVNGLESDMKSEFARYYTQHRKNINMKLVVDQFLHKYKARLREVIPQAPKSPDIFEGPAKEFRRYMYHVNDIHSKCPNNMDMPDASKSPDAMKKKMEFKRRISYLIELVGLYKDGGCGNMRASLNYRLEPFLFRLGYENDRDVVESVPGTGLRAPRIRFFPKIHLNVNL